MDPGLPRRSSIGNPRARPPEPSPVSIIILVLSLIIMPVLAAAEKKAGTALGDNLILAAAAETRICVLLSVSTCPG